MTELVAFDGSGAGSTFDVTVSLPGYDFDRLVAGYADADAWNVNIRLYGRLLVEGVSFSAEGAMVPLDRPIPPGVRHDVRITGTKTNNADTRIILRFSRLPEEEC